jgi:hypothetical protein
MKKQRKHYRPSWQRRAAGDWADRLHVGAGEDGDHAGVIERGLGVDGTDFGGGMRAAQHAGVMYTGHLDIIHIGGRASDEARIFFAADALAAQFFGLDDGGGSPWFTLLLSPLPRRLPARGADCRWRPGPRWSRCHGRRLARRTWRRISPLCRPVRRVHGRRLRSRNRRGGR